MLTIQDVVDRILRNHPNRSGRPIRQQAIDALNELLSEAMPFGPDRIAEGHDLAARLDDIVSTTQAALAPTKESTTSVQ